MGSYDDVAPSWAQAYFNWFFTISADRDPRTLADFCEQHGIGRDRVHRLENSQSWQAMLAKGTGRGGFTSHQIARVKDATLGRALAGDTKAQEIILKMSGEYVPTEKREVSTPAVDLAKLGDAELWEHLAERAATQAAAHAAKTKENT